MRARLSLWLDTRSAPVVATVTLLVLGMGYSLFWLEAVHGGPINLEVGSDLSSFVRSASALGHGHFSAIYYPGTKLTSPPALELLLAPVVGLAQWLGLAPQVHGGAFAGSFWLVLGPVTILLASTALFAVDAVARQWGLGQPERLALGFMSAVGVADVAIYWGHPEVCISLALVLWAAVVVDRDGPDGLGRAGWLLGLAVAFQPLAILGVAPILARYPWRVWLRLSYRLVLPSLLLLAAPFVAAPAHTWYIQLHEPFDLRFTSRTPLTHLAPLLGPGVRGGGPTRLLSTVLGVVLGLLVCRKRHALSVVLFITAVAFTLRLLLESELTGYYFWPVIGLCLPLALRRGWLRFGLAAAAALATITLGNHRVHDIGTWWPAVMATTLVMVVLAVPAGLFGPVDDTGVSGNVDEVGVSGVGEALREVGVGRGDAPP
jgi:hypothetical protein